MLPYRFMGLLRTLLVFTVLFMVFQTRLSFAEGSCPVSSPQDILQCALAQDPDVIRTQFENRRDEKLVDIAKQRPNLELNTRILGGEDAGSAQIISENSLLHTIELGQKRNSRIDQAKVNIEKSKLEIKRSQEEVLLQSVLALYRLRQIKSEFARIDETISAFSKILFTFKSRPELTPEQEVSQASFLLAKEDYKLKKITLEQKQSELVTWLEMVSQVPASIILQHLPTPKKQWPEIAESIDANQLSNSAIESARIDKNLAEKNIAMAKSKAWPDLKIGPSFDTDSQINGTTSWAGGLHFFVPLPVLNLNRGEKAFAQADHLRAQNELDLSIRKTSSERTLQWKRYQAALKALRGSQSLQGLALQHENIENYFEKGLVPSTLVIETHNQLYEVTKTRNEQELDGIDALWRLYIIEGKAFDSKI